MVNSFEQTLIGKPEQWLIETGAIIQIDFSKLVHEITNEFINHSIKRHGDPKIHGGATITTEDFDRIADIVKTPDFAIIGAMRKKTLMNAYAKIDNGITFLYFEEVLISRRNKALRGKTFYKVTRQLSLDEVLEKVSRTGKTDISKAVIFHSQINVQPAGGHPGG